MKTIKKGIKVLNILSENNEGLTTSEISDKVNINKSTVSRILKTYEKEGYVYKGSHHKYELDLGLLKLTGKLFEKYEIIHEAIPYMVDLLNKIGHRIYLGVLWRDQVINLYHIHNTDNSLYDLNIENGAPLHTSSLSKVILAFSDEKDIRELLSNTSMKKFTQNTITDIDEFIDELKKVKENGYAINDCEHLSEVRSVATPIKNYEGKVIAGVAVADKSLTLKKIKKIIPKLKSYSKKISFSLGYNSESII